MTKYEKLLLWVMGLIAVIAVCFRFHALWFFPRYELIEYSYTLFRILLGIPLAYGYILLLQLAKRLIRLLDYRLDNLSKKKDKDEP